MRSENIIVGSLQLRESVECAHVLTPPGPLGMGIGHHDRHTEDLCSTYFMSIDIVSASQPQISPIS